MARVIMPFEYDVILALCEVRNMFVRNNKRENVALAMHCNLKPTDVMPVILLHQHDRPIQQFRNLRRFCNLQPTPHFNALNNQKRSSCVLDLTGSKFSNSAARHFNKIKLLTF